MTFLSAADVRPFGQAKVRKKNNQLYEETKTRKLKRKMRKKSEWQRVRGRKKWRTNGDKGGEKRESDGSEKDGERKRKESGTGKR